MVSGMHQNCFFPVSKRGKAKSGPFNLLSLHKEIAQHNDSLELYQVAWAFLLRNYVCENNVSFVTIEVGTDGAQTFLCQYNLEPNAYIQNLSPQVQMLKDGLQFQSANTSVMWSQDEPSTKDMTTMFCQTPTDLALIVTNNAVFKLAYRTGAISEPFAAAISASFAEIVKQLQTCSENTLSAEIRQLGFADTDLAMSWNPKSPYVQTACMHHLVEASARILPNEEAVCAWDGSFTYAELERVASRMARRLLQTGLVRPGVFIPFAMEKTKWSVVATLGILKSGAAFVPLDPTHPSARLAEIIASTEAKMVVTTAQYSSRFKDLGVQVIQLPSDLDDTSKRCDLEGLCHVESQPDDPIFCLFTSGSTGKPKGMVLEHGAICTHAIAHGKDMGYYRARVLQFSAHTWDVAFMDIFTTLIFGGTVCIPSDEDRKDNVVTVMNEMKVELAILTPLIALILKPSAVPTLKTLAVAGEALPQDCFDRWADKVRFIQAYGPAEVGICLSINFQPFHDHPETVGYALDNCMCWLVNADNPHELVPIGAVGELVIAGPSLARCYLGNDTQTKASFRDDLAWTNSLLPSAYRRVYLSGDLLRYNTDKWDGSYDFVGRKDTQVKLRGQRLELGEIEYHSRAAPAVAVVMASKPTKGLYQNQLVLVVQLSDAKPADPDAGITLARDQSYAQSVIEDHLPQLLPSYMVPSACLIIDRMPLNASLKIDRQSVKSWLEALDPGQSPEVSLDRLEQHEATARLLNEIIIRTLNKPGRSWDYLSNYDFRIQDIGLDSIQIMSLSMKIKDVFGVRLGLKRLLVIDATLRSLAFGIDHWGLEPSNGFNGLDESATVMTERQLRQKGQHLCRDIIQSCPLQEMNGHQEFNGTVGVGLNVLVTGATGFLGRAIAQELLLDSNIHVFALVRCTNPVQGLKNLSSILRRCPRWDPGMLSRLHVIPADLSESGLLKVLERYDASIHSIIHAGAVVHYSSSYDKLAPVNVDATAELLRFAARNQSIKRFVFITGGLRPSVDEMDEHEVLQALPAANGYAQTKFVSETAVEICATAPSFQTKSVSIVKPGYIIGSVMDGMANQTDFLWRLVAGCIEIEMINVDELDHWLFVADVDRVAAVAVTKGRGHDWNQYIDPTELNTRGSHIGILDGLWFGDLWDILRNRFGYKLEGQQTSKWINSLKSRVVAAGETHLLFPLLHTLEDDGPKIGIDTAKVQTLQTKPRRTLQPVIRNIEYLIEVGFLPPPHK